MITTGENETVEFKLDKVRNEHLAKELGALSNFRGGTLLLGVSDKGDLVGIDRNDNEERLQNIAYSFEPPLSLKIVEHIIKDRIILEVKIFEISGKPYVYKSNTRNIYYIRSGSISREATRAEVRRMFQSSAELHFEVAPVNKTSLQDFDMFLLNSFLMDYRSISLDDLDKQEQLSLLENLSLITSDHRATILGIILFGKKPVQFLPGAYVQIVVYQNNNRDSKVHDHKVFSKALIAELPMIISYLTNHNPHSFDGLKGQRVENVKYPDFALREALVNALCHRDYTLQGAGILIEIFPDSMIIQSPGGLPNTQTINRIKTGMSYARNPLLFQYLYDFKYVERLGRGVLKIIASMKSNGNKEPEFIDGNTYFKIMLHS